MRRLTGLALAVVLVVVVGRAGGRPGAGREGSAYGGFGLEYTQPIPSNSLVLDRWWMLEATPMVDPRLPQSGAVGRSPRRSGRPMSAAEGGSSGPIVGAGR